MMEGATRFYEKMGEWQSDVPAPFTADAFRFIQEIERSRSSR
jgi:hypothetical protein